MSYHKLKKDTATAKSGDYVEVKDKNQKKHLINSGVIEEDGVDELPKDEDEEEKPKLEPKVSSTADIVDPKEVVKEKDAK